MMYFVLLKVTKTALVLTRSKQKCMIISCECLFNLCFCVCRY